MASDALSDYTTAGETWRVFDNDRSCPECGAGLSTNGRVLVCNNRWEHTETDCDWWEKRD
jgi:predicted amidophosphoribosyltransferase